MGHLLEAILKVLFKAIEEVGPHLAVIVAKLSAYLAEPDTKIELLFWLLILLALALGYSVIQWWRKSPANKGADPDRP